jgi:CRP-like cAMP-binding protein
LTQDGKRHVLSILGPGDVFGLTSGAVYDCTVEPIVESIVRRLEYTSLERSGALQSYVMKQLQIQLEASRAHAVRLQRRSAEEKLASFLMSLPHTHPGRVEDDDCQPASERIMLSLVDIADYLSLRMETVCRVLSRFRQRGLIAMRAKGQLTILNPNRLFAISCPID